MDVRIRLWMFGKEKLANFLQETSLIDWLLLRYFLNPYFFLYFLSPSFQNFVGLLISPLLMINCNLLKLRLCLLDRWMFLCFVLWVVFILIFSWLIKWDCYDGRKWGDFCWCAKCSFILVCLWPCVGMWIVSICLNQNICIILKKCGNGHSDGNGYGNVSYHKILA